MTTSSGESSKTSIIVAIVGFAGIAFGALGTYLATLKTAELTQQVNNRELDLKMVDVSLGILRGEKGDPQDAKRNVARKFAIHALLKHSGMEGALSVDEIEKWITQDELKFDPTIMGMAALGSPFITSEKAVSSKQEGSLVGPDKSCISQLRNRQTGKCIVFNLVD